MSTIVTAVLAGGIPAALGLLLLRSTSWGRAAQSVDLAPQAEAPVRDGAVRAYRNPAQRGAAHPAHPAVRPDGLTFDEAVDQALAVANATDENTPRDPSNPNDPTTMPKQHPANCQCGRCRTSAEGPSRVLRAAKPTGHPKGCGCEFCNPKGGFTASAAPAGPVEIIRALHGLWAGLSTDQEFALAHDRLLDTAAPASLVLPQPSGGAR